MKERSIRDYFHLMWMTAIVLCAVTALFVTLFVSCTKAPAGQAPAVSATAAAQTSEPSEPSAPADTPEATPEATPEPTPEPIPTELQLTDDMGQEYLDKCIFLGDSTTYGMLAYGVLPKSQIWTPSSGTLTLNAQSYAEIDVYADDGSSRSMSIRDAVAEIQPEILVVTLGVNGISFMDEASFKEEYTDLIGAIQDLSPDTKIICHSIYPVIDWQAPEGINNERVNAANVWVYDIAVATGTRYLNTHDALMGPDGNLVEDYGNGDGIHLDPDGFAIVLNSVRTHGYR